MSLLVWVFILQLSIHLINTVGATTINAILWNLYNRLPTPTSESVARQRKLQTDFLRLRKELNATSSQDEFAKWAKLRRQHDKVMEDLEKTKSSLESTKSTFTKAISALRWLGTTGLRTLLQFYFQKEAMFWIPSGWIPYYAEWLLSFPRAPLGSVSIQAWGLACAAVILLVSDAIAAVVEMWVQRTAQGSVKEKRKEEPFAAEVKGEKGDIKSERDVKTSGRDTGDDDWMKGAVRGLRQTKAGGKQEL